MILFGEHAVVYGYPAIAIPLLDVRASAAVLVDAAIKTPIIEAKDLDIVVSRDKAKNSDSTVHLSNAINLFEQRIKPLPASGWRLNIWSKIPFSRGLGSSAAISIAILRALAASVNADLTPNQLIDLSYELEKHHHGTPSGIDNAVVSMETPLLFKKGSEAENIQPKPFLFVVGDTGVGKKTSDVVKFVASNYEHQPAKYRQIFENIGQLTRQGKTALETGDIDNLGELIDENQSLLNELGVSSPELDKLINSAKNAGAHAAKLCGAGKGGCMVALASDEAQAAQIASELLRAGAVRTFVTRLK